MILLYCIDIYWGVKEMKIWAAMKKYDMQGILPFNDFYQDVRTNMRCACTLDKRKVALRGDGCLEKDFQNAKLKIR